MRGVVFRNKSGLPRGRHHGGPSHADLVKCTAASRHHPGAASVATRSMTKKRVPGAGLAGQPYALAKGRAAAGAKWSARRTVGALA